MKNFLTLSAMALLVMSCGKSKDADGVPTPSKVETVTEVPATAPAETLTETDAQLALGKEIFNGKGTCMACHLPDKKVVGPSIKEIAEIYKTQNGDMKAFLLEKAEPIVDQSQYVTMKANFTITKNLPENELDAVIAYIKSFQ